MEVVEFLRNPEKFNKIGAKMHKGILLVGPPGTGKTLLAKAVAGEAGVPFFSISGSEFVEMYAGVGAARVRDLFEKAKEKAPCIIFIDEIDAVGKQRSGGGPSAHDEREQTLNQLLVEMDGFDSGKGIIVLAATNRADVLDPALLRPGRFDRKIFVDLPTFEDRKKILELHMKTRVFDNINLDSIAKLTSGFSGADLANLVNEAAFIALRKKHEKITQDDMEEAIEKIIIGNSKNKIITQKEKELIAFHELGHAFCTYYHEPGKEIHKISIVPKGNAGGYVYSTEENDKFLYTKEELQGMIISLLGGRAAEEVFLRTQTTGASNDLNRAFNLAYKMVVDFGMSNLGFISRLNSDNYFSPEIDQNTMAKVFDEAKNIVSECYEKALKTIREHKDKIIFVKEQLITKEVMSGEELVELIRSN